VKALDAVSLSIERGECHALMGENGAGKSTLGKILAGIHRADAGQVWIGARLCDFRSPRDAARAGVGMVHQELAFCPDLSVAENLVLGRYPRKLGLWVDRAAMHERARAQLAGIGAGLDPDQPMRALTTGQEQLVQIAAAIGSGARILVFDEPTSSLSELESRRLFGLIERLKADGVTVIYISHRLPEVLRLCDRISVLRDGRHVGTLSRAEANEDSLVRLMIGRSLSADSPRHLRAQPGEEVLGVRGLSSPGRFRDVTFSVRAGEVVGLAGLVGAGRSELSQAVFGLDRQARGAVWVGGCPVNPRSARSAMRSGLGLVPEDRKRQGLALAMGGRTNFSLANLDRLGSRGFLRHAKEARETQEFFRRLDVRTPSLDTPVSALSGGNQQKVVLAKWLARPLKALIVDEPTRGVDVGAKAGIHNLLDQLAVQGLGILLISSDLPEILNLSSRILVMRDGRLVGELPREGVTQDDLLRLMSGG
jgi:ABC-type sugar transport system ATPase subunit